MLKELVVILCIFLASCQADPNSCCGCNCKTTTTTPKPECSKICPLIYQPVCGFNPNENTRQTQFKTFGNDCERNRTSMCNGPGRYYYFIYDGPCCPGPVVCANTTQTC